MPEAQSTAKRTHVVRLGNHWLQTDDRLEFPEFVQCLSQATLHTRKWVDGYAQQQLQENRRVEVFTFKDALRMQQKSAQEAVKLRWLSAFHHRTTAAYGEQIETIGIWINAHMHYGQGLTVDEAVNAVAKSFGIITR